jgi:hypothetical protein
MPLRAMPHHAKSVSEGTSQRRDTQCTYMYAPFLRYSQSPLLPTGIWHEYKKQTNTAGEMVCYGVETSQTQK